ncbi:MAG: hypothetical protein WDO14_18915 [Bacteroidota bacterium]
MWRVILAAVLISFAATPSHAQSTEWLIYTRAIRDSKGNSRFDQNVVPNIRINNLFRVELGIRYGETTDAFDAYYHYKVELQTRSFWRTLKLFARLSDNIWKAPTVYSRSNYLVVAESKFALHEKFSLLVGAGAVAQYQRDNVKDAVPSFSGSRKIFPTYRLTARYHATERWFLDAVYGAYDTFNPYPSQSPFLQFDTEYDLNGHVALYGYFRYQFDHHVDSGLNDFLGLGLRLKR